MEKPSTMDTKEWCTMRVSQELQVPQVIVRAVIKDQFESMKEAVKEHNTIELAGFGKFIFNERRAKKRLKEYGDVLKILEERLKDDTQTEAQHRNTRMKITTVENNALHLKGKINEFKANN